ncbi:MAG TPA: GatB/YqeY domain-containing protein [Actinomycetota bacterium]|nr:GatB/YqeY domain-containing protein [Actinomycetota bacterium]
MADVSLKTRLQTEMREALRSGDKVRLGALRMLSAGITNREKELRHELSDDEVRDVAAREVKRRSESIEAFAKGGRQDLVDKETAERDVLAAYAPERLSEAEVDALVEEAIAETGATSMREMGKVMGAVMARGKGRVEGNVVQAKVRQRLA